MVSFAFNLANVAQLSTSNTTVATVGLLANTKITGSLTSTDGGVFVGNVTAANFFGNAASFSTISNLLAISTSGVLSVGSNATISGNTSIGGTATIAGNTSIGGNAIIAGDITANGLNLSGIITWADGSQLFSGVAGSAVFDYTGNGASTTFSTGNYFASDKLNTNVYIGGVYQRKNQYDWVSTNIIFSSPPPNGANIEIVILTLSTSGLANASVQSTAIGQGGPTWDSGGNVSVKQTLYANVIIANTSILSPASTFSVGNVTTGNVTARNTVTANYLVANISFQAATFVASNALVFSDGTSLTSMASSSTFFQYTGDGVTSSYSTGNYSASNNAATSVFIGGVYQRKTNYSWVGTNIVFTSPPPSATPIEININLLGYAIGTINAGTVYPTGLTTGGPSWDVTGNVSVTKNLYANAVVSNTTITSAGNVTVGGNLAVTGNTTVSGNVTLSRFLTVSSNANVNGNLIVAGDLNVSGTLRVTGQIYSANAALLTVNNALLYNLAF